MVRGQCVIFLASDAITVIIVQILFIPFFFLKCVVVSLDVSSGNASYICIIYIYIINLIRVDNM